MVRLICCLSLPTCCLILVLFFRGLLHDPNTYPNPSIFSPERYLDRLSDGIWKLREDVPDPRKFSFGYGRRVCPGVHLVEQAMFSILTAVLQALDIRRVKDNNGQEVIPEARMSSNLLSHPLPFPYAISARTDAQQLLDQCAVATEK
jgi:cytochrome P450